VKQQGKQVGRELPKKVRILNAFSSEKLEHKSFSVRREKKENGGDRRGSGLAGSNRRKGGENLAIQGEDDKTSCNGALETTWEKRKLESTKEDALGGRSSPFPLDLNALARSNQGVNAMKERRKCLGVIPQVLEGKGIGTNILCGRSLKSGSHENLISDI